MFICEILIVRLVFSSILHIWYVEVRISRSVSAGPFDFEITRVDCKLSLNPFHLYKTSPSSTRAAQTKQGEYKCSEILRHVSLYIAS